jgi:phosphate acetyltransferase
MTSSDFQNELFDKARKLNKRIVLPEGNDDRVLKAADIVLKDGLADIIILDADGTANERAEKLGLDLTKAEIVNPSKGGERVNRFAEEYARLRAHKGITIDQASEKMKDLSYFATMMVHFGEADGMVSGALHTTAETIKPSFEIIKTTLGSSVVSGAFIMVFNGNTLLFADCAVNPNPTSDQLAEIAVTSAKTAKQFGIDSKVAMLSYSTGFSGKGPDVDAVREAAAKAKSIAPDVPIEGPIQYDAAVSPDVAKTKLPESEVAGKATVLIFPDLQSGNITYKAVQRSANALAIGPILQGLKKPVNDLSRGALVDDIVNTIAITAVQASI